MDIIKIIQIDEVIKGGRSGTPKQLSEKLQISERMLYYIINFMKEELEAPIKYSRVKQRYYYEGGEGQLNLRWQEKTNFTPFKVNN
jgi:transcriptional antiterminator